MRKLMPVLVMSLVLFFSLTLFATPARADYIDGVSYAIYIASETMVAATYDNYNCEIGGPYGYTTEWCVSMYVSNFEYSQVLRDSFREYYLHGLSRFSGLYWGTPAEEVCESAFGTWQSWAFGFGDPEGYYGCINTVNADLAYWAY